MKTPYALTINAADVQRPAYFKELSAGLDGVDPGTRISVTGGSHAEFASTRLNLKGPILDQVGSIQPLAGSPGVVEAAIEVKLDRERIQRLVTALALGIEDGGWGDVFLPEVHDHANGLQSIDDRHHLTFDLSSNRQVVTLKVAGIIHLQPSGGPSSGWASFVADYLLTQYLVSKLSRVAEIMEPAEGVTPPTVPYQQD